MRGALPRRFIAVSFRPGVAVAASPESRHHVSRIPRARSPRHGPVRRAAAMRTSLKVPAAARSVRAPPSWRIRDDFAGRPAVGRRRSPVCAKLCVGRLARFLLEHVGMRRPPCDYSPRRSGISDQLHLARPFVARRLSLHRREMKCSLSVRQGGPEVRGTEDRKDMDRQNTLVVACAIVVLLVLLTFLEIRIQRMERAHAYSAEPCEAVSRHVERDRPTLTTEGKSTPSPIDSSSLSGHPRYS